jgi:hypothetical protein
LLSPILNGRLFLVCDGKSIPISFEKMLEDYVEPSKLETVFKLYTILKIANANPLNELKRYFDFRLAEQQELIIREKISISSMIYQEEMLEITFFDKKTYSIIYFKPFLKSNIYYNSFLSSLVLSPSFIELITVDRKLSEDEMRICPKCNSFVERSRMKVLEVMVHHYFTNSKEYKMRCLYDDDFAYWWKLRLK